MLPAHAEYVKVFHEKGYDSNQLQPLPEPHAVTGHPCCVHIMQTVMRIVDAVVKRTSADVSDSAKVLQDILAAAANERGEWELPLSQEKTAAMRQALEDRSEHLSEVRWHPKMQQDPALVNAALDTSKCRDHPVR